MHTMIENAFQTELSAADIAHLVGCSNPLILEVGANCGQSTLTFIDQMPMATIHCFEPDPRAIAKFKLLVNNPQIHLIEAAVGADSGFVMFNQSSGAEAQHPSGWDHSGSIRKPKSHLETWPWVKFEKQIPVPLITLDEWCLINDVHHVDFIWADVQGAESDLILGAQSILQRTKYFYTEFSDDEWYEGQINFDVLNALMENLGFKVLHKFKNDVLFSNVSQG